MSQGRFGFRGTATRTKQTCCDLSTARSLSSSAACTACLLRSSCSCRWTAAHLSHPWLSWTESIRFIVRTMSAAAGGGEGGGGVVVAGW